MSVAALPTDAIAPDEIKLFRFSVDQYHELINRGILTADDHVELLEGWVVEKMSKNPPHRMANRLTFDALAKLIPAGWYVDADAPVTTDTSEPEPDVEVIRGSTRDYPDRHPGPADAALIIEIADATLIRDLGLKRRIYARAGVPVYWVIDINQRRAHVFTQPSGPGEKPVYGDAKIYGESDTIPIVIDGREVGQIALRDILP